MDVKCIRSNSKSEIITSYNSEMDTTVIFLDTNSAMEIKGFYYGKPNDADTKQFYGKLKAEF